MSWNKIRVQSPSKIFGNMLKTKKTLCAWRSKDLFSKVKSSWKHALARYKKISVYCLSAVTHILVDSKRFGFIREAVKLDKREQEGVGTTLCYWVFWFPQWQDPFLYCKSYFYCFWVRFCISNQWKIIRGAFRVDGEEGDGGWSIFTSSQNKTRFDVKAQQRAGKNLSWYAALM